MSITQEITQFDDNQKAVEGQAPSIFRANANYSWSFLANFASEIESFRVQANLLKSQTNANADAVSLMKGSIESTKNAIDQEKINIDLKHSEIMSYSIPIEATYNKSTIDKKNQMSQILNLTGAI